MGSQDWLESWILLYWFAVLSSFYFEPHGWVVQALVLEGLDPVRHLELALPDPPRRPVFSLQLLTYSHGGLPVRCIAGRARPRKSRESRRWKEPSACLGGVCCLWSVVWGGPAAQWKCLGAMRLKEGVRERLGLRSARRGGQAPLWCPFGALTKDKRASASCWLGRGGHQWESPGSISLAGRSGHWD